MSVAIRDMTGEEIALFADVIHDLARADPGDDPRALTGERILTLLRADTLASYVWLDSDKKYMQPVTFNHDPEKVRRYIETLQFDDPLTSKMRKLKGAQIVDSVFPMAELNRTEFYCDFLKPDDMHYGINVFFGAASEKVFDLRIWRGKKGEPFGQREVDLLDTLAHFVGNALASSGQNEMSVLTRREYEIGRLIVRGCTDKEIAELLGIGFSTVRTHVNRCFDKLACSNRAELSARMSSTLHA